MSTAFHEITSEVPPKTNSSETRYSNMSTTTKDTDMEENSEDVLENADRFIADLSYPEPVNLEEDTKNDEVKNRIGTENMSTLPFKHSYSDSTVHSPSMNSQSIPSIVVSTTVKGKIQNNDALSIYNKDGENEENSDVTHGQTQIIGIHTIVKRGKDSELNSEEGKSLRNSKDRLVLMNKKVKKKQLNRDEYDDEDYNQNEIHHADENSAENKILHQKTGSEQDHKESNLNEKFSNNNLGKHTGEDNIEGFRNAEEGTHDDAFRLNENEAFAHGKSMGQDLSKQKTVHKKIQSKTKNRIEAHNDDDDNNVNRNGGTRSKMGHHHMLGIGQGQVQKEKRPQFWQHGGNSSRVFQVGPVNLKIQNDESASDTNLSFRIQRKILSTPLWIIDNTTTSKDDDKSVSAPVPEQVHKKDVQLISYDSRKEESFDDVVKLNDLNDTEALNTSQITMGNSSNIYNVLKPIIDNSSNDEIRNGSWIVRYGEDDVKFFEVKRENLSTVDAINYQNLPGGDKKQDPKLTCSYFFWFVLSNPRSILLCFLMFCIILITLVLLWIACKMSALQSKGLVEKHWNEDEYIEKQDKHKLKQVKFKNIPDTSEDNSLNSNFTSSDLDEKMTPERKMMDTIRTSISGAPFDSKIGKINLMKQKFKNGKTASLKRTPSMWSDFPAEFIRRMSGISDNSEIETGTPKKAQIEVAKTKGLNEGPGKEISLIGSSIRKGRKKSTGRKSSVWNFSPTEFIRRMSGISDNSESEREPKSSKMNQQNKKFSISGLLNQGNQNTVQSSGHESADNSRKKRVSFQQNSTIMTIADGSGDEEMGAMPRLKRLLSLTSNDRKSGGQKSPKLDDDLRSIVSDADVSSDLDLSSPETQKTLVERIVVTGENDKIDRMLRSDDFERSFYHAHGVESAVLKAPSRSGSTESVNKLLTSSKAVKSTLDDVDRASKSSLESVERNAQLYGILPKTLSSAGSLRDQVQMSAKKADARTKVPLPLTKHEMKANNYRYE